MKQYEVKGYVANCKASIENYKLMLNAKQNNR